MTICVTFLGTQKSYENPTTPHPTHHHKHHIPMWDKCSKQDVTYCPAKPHLLPSNRYGFDRQKVWFGKASLIGTKTAEKQ